MFNHAVVMLIIVVLRLYIHCERNWYFTAAAAATLARSSKLSSSLSERLLSGERLYSWRHCWLWCSLVPSNIEVVEPVPATAALPDRHSQADTWRAHYGRRSVTGT